MKPCPFCNKVPDLTDPDTLYPGGVWKDTVDSGRIYGNKKSIPDYHGRCYTMHCSCGASMTGDSKEEVIQQWETRALCCVSCVMGNVN